MPSNLSKNTMGLPVMTIGYDGKVHAAFYSIKRKGYEAIEIENRLDLLEKRLILTLWL